LDHWRGVHDWGKSTFLTKMDYVIWICLEIERTKVGGLGRREWHTLQGGERMWQPFPEMAEWTWWIGQLGTEGERGQVN
jgi:hypothetical protein